MKHLLAAARALAFILWTFALLPVQLYGLLRGTPLRTALPVFYHRAVTRILGIRVEIWGRRVEGGPVLFVANHASWLDIVVLGSSVRASFVSRHDVKDWPGIGVLARLQRSVFIERKSRLAADHRDEIGARLEAGDNLILFPEGTSSDGNHVLPFKSALFAVAERRIDGTALTVQPVSVAYAQLDGMPVGRERRHLFAWYGDMDFGSHAWRVLGLGPSKVVVAFHPPVRIDDFADRKALAEYCRERVADGHARAVHGRPPPPQALERPATAAAALAGARDS